MYSIYQLVKYIFTGIGFFVGAYLGATFFCRLIGLSLMTNHGTFLMGMIWGVIAGFIVAFVVNFIFNLFDPHRFGSREWKHRKREL